MTPGPEERTLRQRAAVLGSLLGDFLDVVPTEQSRWAEGAEETRRREQQAREISDQMTAVYEAGR